MFKMLFLPRGYLTIAALFWAYDYGLFDEMSLPTGSPTTTTVTEWLKAEERSESETVPTNELIPPAEFSSLKEQILEELSSFDQQTAPIKRSSPDTLQVNSHAEQEFQRRSEVPRDIMNYLHKIFR